MSYMTDVLIDEVYVRRPLWDQKDKNHHNRYMLGKLWDQVAERLHSTRKDTRAKWNNLRDKFCIEVTKNLNGADLSTEDEFDSSWPYYERLIFLKDQFTPRESQGEFDPSTEDPATLDPATLGLLGKEDSLCTLARCPSADSVASTVSRKRCQQNLLEEGILPSCAELLQIEEKKPEALTEEKSNKHLAFFESLLPHIDKLPDEKKMLLMIEIQQVVYRHVYGQPADQSSILPDMGSNPGQPADQSFILPDMGSNPGQPADQSSILPDMGSNPGQPADQSSILSDMGSDMGSNPEPEA